MGRGEEVTGGELLLQDGDFLKNLGQSGRKTLHHLVFYVLVVGECRKMPVMRCIIPANQHYSIGILPMERIVPFVLIIKLSGKQDASVTNLNFDFEVEAIIPSAKLQNLEIRDDRRLLK